MCIILIAPFYGARKPDGQNKWFLRQVDDSFLQATGIALEAACLLHWAKKTWGASVPLATAGLSFGGAMAALSAKMYGGPLAIVSYMGCLGPGEPYTEGRSPISPVSFVHLENFSLLCLVAYVVLWLSCLTACSLVAWEHQRP